MDLLLDTHALLWLVRGEARARPVVELVERDEVSGYVSVASVLEVAIKHSIGKLPEDVAMIRNAIRTGGLVELAIDATVPAAVEALPLHHRDPFDRMLIAQASITGLTIVTADPLFEAYDVPLVKLAQR